MELLLKMNKEKQKIIVMINNYNLILMKKFVVIKKIIMFLFNKLNMLTISKKVNVNEIFL
jgi:hypothetical protein